MILIGICGASGSGKTTLATELLSSLDGKAVILTQDTYYKNYAHLSFEERCQLNYDAPEIFDHDLLYQDVIDFFNGKQITRKGYDYTVRCRQDTAEIIEPKDVLIVEGIHAFYDQRLVDVMDFRIFVQAAPEICLLRRIERDIKERGRTIDSISKQYLETVRPMYEKYIKSYIERADITVMHGGKNSKIVPILVGYIQNMLQKNIMVGE